MSQDVDFELASKNIVAVLERKSSELEEKERIKFIYNEAIDDAANFVKNLIKPNPQYATAYHLMEKEIRKWLVLR